VLSYRHSYHAGNFADVLKHLVLQRTLTHLTAKDKALCYIDTHAGAGGYRLGSAHAQKTQEFNTGIGKLWSAPDLPKLVAEYVDAVARFNPGKSLTHYPGSPWFAANGLRKQDRLFLHEIHPSDLEPLQETFKADRRIRIIGSDGYKGCLGLVPPIQRRGLVLIDPPYEIKSDYHAVVDLLKNAYLKFSTGVYALWYPVVDRYRIRELEQALVKSGIRNIQLFELGIHEDSLQHGMSSSGMILINPPWKLKEELESVLPYLADTLGVDGEGHYRIEQLVGE
jgi:23S rRNA (adenine2030-N6)-methyltransferase